MKGTGKMSTKILAAVSGGADSMCMLHKLMPDVVAAHFNHKMRGAESDRDADFVRQYCEDNGIEYVIGCAQTVLHSEEEARKARYDFLNKAAADFGCKYIATAHTKDDNAETVILNLCRGAGAKGLSGIPRERDNIIRPIIDITRAEVEQYNLQNNIPHVEDSTNMSDDYSRNIIRHKVIPVLREINPNVVEAIFRTSELMKTDEDYFDRLISDELSEHEKAVESRVIRNSCPKSLSYSQVEAVLNMGDGYKMIDLPGIRVVKDRGRLYFEERKPEFEVTLEECIVNNELTKDYIKYDSINGRLEVSVRRPGDKLKVANRNCTKTLKQLFLENDMTQAERDSWPVIRDDEGVLWVYNIAVADRAKAKIGDRAYKISVTEK